MAQVSAPGGNFDWVAPGYDALSSVVFGQKLRQAQILFIDKIPPGASILIVGGGTGWLLEQVLTRCQPGRMLYLETSAGMVNLASRRMVKKALVGTVEFRVGDETTLRPDEHFDVLITPFLLDLFTEATLQSQLIPKLLNALTKDGLWLVTDFVCTDIWWQKALVRTMIQFFRITAGIETSQLVDWQRLLTEAGLTRTQRQPQVGGMVSAEVWSRVSQ
ncbi:class I SAM-dependent methyltransferase [Spirosoma soli]|uniref:Class I SAM-dependent methyltransferase n=1 Tax=Spirosoma soli TaxID=1770529 RepID=A0ABW5M4E0_9BACT